MKINKPAPSHRVRRAALALPVLGGEMPTPERQRQGDVQLVEETGPDGRTVTHCRVSDSVARLLRSGQLEPAWAVAAERFRRDFHMARFDPLSAADLQRLRGAGGTERIVDRVEAARERIWRAMQRLGGMSSPAASAVWFVVGAELSVQQWALRQVWGGGRSLRHEVATGILIAGLAALDSAYAEMRRGDRSSH